MANQTSAPGASAPCPHSAWGTTSPAQHSTHLRGALTVGCSSQQPLNPMYTNTLDTLSLRDQCGPWETSVPRDLSFKGVEATREGCSTDLHLERSCRGDGALQLQRLSCRVLSCPQIWDISMHACYCNPQPGQLLELLYLPSGT